MTRGRKKDLTIPPTRALAQQRDYRARRANYITDLEGRVRKAEEENAQLRKDLAIARAGQAIPATMYDPQAAQAATELMQNLALASASLTQFQHLAFPEGQPLIGGPVDSLRPKPSSQSWTHPGHEPVLNGLRPASFPSPAPSPPCSQTTSTSAEVQPNTSGRKRLYREDSPSAPSPASSWPQQESPLALLPVLSSRDPECCEGIMDCRGLVETSEDDDSDDSSSVIPRTYGLHSTSERDVSMSYRPESAIR